VITIKTAAAETNPPAIVATIIAQLATIFPQDRLEMGGLKVITTIDLQMQQQTECALQLQLARLQLRSAPPSENGITCAASLTLPSYIGLRQPLSAELSGSVVVMDPQSGEVLALVGDSHPGSAGSFLAHP